MRPRLDTHALSWALAEPEKLPSRVADPNFWLSQKHEHYRYDLRLCGNKWRMSKDANRRMPMRQGAV